jgi:hypothetical protein
MRTVYLDQNVLSQLRRRKVSENPDAAASRLHCLLSANGDGIRLVYSSVHLAEILQIRNKEFVTEHLDLLGELSALYIEPGTRRLVDTAPSAVWAGYMQNNEDNDRLGISQVVAAFEATQRRLAGLSAIDQPDLADALSQMIAGAERSLTDLEKDGTAPRVYIENMRRVFSDLRARTGTMQSMPESSGPGPFRELRQVRDLDLEKLPSKQVIPALESLFGGALATFDWSKSGGATLEGRISRYYYLMNWAGYSADDFTRKKKGRDRFRASGNDMLHTLHAAGMSFLVTEDVALQRKAMACYVHLGIETIVLTTSEFLNTPDIV